MREIILRGKCLKTGEWFYGSLVHQTEYYGEPVDRYHIIYGGEFDWDYYDAVVVAPETVSQYTGLKDKNGKMIFEGDVIIGCDVYGKNRGRGIVVWSDLFLGWHYDGLKTLLKDSVFKYEIIGNIHDNPELLEG